MTVLKIYSDDDNESGDDVATVMVMAQTLTSPQKNQQQQQQGQVQGLLKPNITAEVDVALAADSSVPVVPPPVREDDGDESRSTGGPQKRKSEVNPEEPPAAAAATISEDLDDDNVTDNDNPSNSVPPSSPSPRRKSTVTETESSSSASSASRKCPSPSPTFVSVQDEDALPQQLPALLTFGAAAAESEKDQEDSPLLLSPSPRPEDCRPNENDAGTATTTTTNKTGIAATTSAPEIVDNSEGQGQGQGHPGSASNSSSDVAVLEDYYDYDNVEDDPDPWLRSIFNRQLQEQDGAQFSRFFADRVLVAAGVGSAANPLSLSHLWAAEDDEDEDEGDEEEDEEDEDDEEEDEEDEDDEEDLENDDDKEKDKTLSDGDGDAGGGRDREGLGLGTDWEVVVHQTGLQSAKILTPPRPQQPPPHLFWSHQQLSSPPSAGLDLDRMDIVEEEDVEDEVEETPTSTPSLPRVRLYSVGVGFGILDPVQEDQEDQGQRHAASSSSSRDVGGQRRGRGTSEEPETGTATRKESLVLTLKDFGGYLPEIKEISKLCLHLRHPHFFPRLGIKPAAGFFLTGPPGVGKTLLVQSLSAELGLPIFKLNSAGAAAGAEARSIFPPPRPSLAQQILALFEAAVALSPSLVLIDGPQWGEICNNENDDKVGVGLTQLVTCIDDLVTCAAPVLVVIVAAPATPAQELGDDHPLRRAGRLDRVVHLGPPDLTSRERILRILTKGLRTCCPSPEGDDDDCKTTIDLEAVAQQTEGMVGAELQVLVRDAVTEAIFGGCYGDGDGGELSQDLVVKTEDFDVALDAMRKRGKQWSSSGQGQGQQIPPGQCQGPKSPSPTQGQGPLAPSAQSLGLGPQTPPAQGQGQALAPQISQGQGQRQSAFCPQSPQGQLDEQLQQPQSPSKRSGPPSPSANKVDENFSVTPNMTASPSNFETEFEFVQPEPPVEPKNAGVTANATTTDDDNDDDDAADAEARRQAWNFNDPATATTDDDNDDDPDPEADGRRQHWNFEDPASKASSSSAPLGRR